MKKRRSTTIPGTSGIWTFSLVLCSMVFMHVFSYNASACEPDCGPCMHWDDEAGEDGECVLNTGATCSEDADCGGGCGLCDTEDSCDCYASDELCTGECDYCYTATSGSYYFCADDDENCSAPTPECVDGKCVECEWYCSTGQECCGGTCITECDSSDCMECDPDSNTCVSECSDPNKPHCYLRACVQCRNILDCALCETCEYNRCKHPCDDCVWPKYCGAACTCVECTEGTEDTTTCSTSNSFTECDCSINIFSPCYGSHETKVYSGHSLESCTGDDCETRNDVLCYTTYSKCEVSGAYKALHFCVGPAGPFSCTTMEIPGPGCYLCVRDSFELGIETFETRGVCPTELWPD